MASRSRGKLAASLIDRHRNRARLIMAYCSVVAQVRLDHITKSFGDGAAAVKAVDDVSLDIEDHDFMILFGPSGCGKSTLLRMVAGLEDSDQRRDLHRQPEGQRHRAEDARCGDGVPELRPVPAQDGARANIEFPLEGARRESKVGSRRQSHGGGRGAWPRRVPRSQTGSARRWPTSTCRTRSAIVRQPAVFCMDEPLSNLDAKLRGETRAELVDLHRRLDSDDHLRHPRSGRGNDDGNACRGDEPWPTPADRHTARGLRQTRNRVRGHVHRNTTDERDARTGCSSAAMLSSAVRPEHLRVSTDGGLAATVRMVEQLGHETLLICDAAGRGWSPVKMQSSPRRRSVPRSSSTRRRSTVTGSTRSPCTDWMREEADEAKVGRDLPVALGMLAPSAVILGVFVVFPLVRAIQLGHLRCDATGKRCREGDGVNTSTCSEVTSSSTRWPTTSDLP